MDNLFVCYDKCTMCRKAQKWLDAHGIEYVRRDIALSQFGTIKKKRRYERRRAV